LFRTEKPLTDSKLKAVRERVRASYSRRRLIASGSDELQNAGAFPFNKSVLPPASVQRFCQRGAGFCFLLRSDGQQVRAAARRRAMADVGGAGVDYAGGLCVFCGQRRRVLDAAVKGAAALHAHRSPTSCAVRSAKC
jgi:hypothetical protein